jgi:flagellar biosynthesis/type III secretory pathway M-ring protein FliF/YscJ
VANVPFKIQPAAPAQPGAPATIKEIVQTPMGMGVAAGALLVFGLMMFFMMKRKKKAVAVTEPEAIVAPALHTSPIAQAVREEVAVAAEKIVLSEDPRKEQLAQIAHDYHDATVRIIRTWLQEEAAKGRATGANGSTSTSA